jgi:hypothetical protein
VPSRRARCRPVRCARGWAHRSTASRQASTRRRSVHATGRDRHQQPQRSSSLSQQRIRCAQRARPRRVGSACGPWAWYVEVGRVARACRVLWVLGG